MNAMLFAAGLGTRLAPLTNTKPKALVEVDDKPLIEYAIEHFYKCGVTSLVVNVHHFSAQIIKYLRFNAKRWTTMEISISDESDALLDTGGGLVKALELFDNDEPIIVGNADVFSNAPIDWLMQQHRQSGNAATLLTKPRDTNRQLLFNESGILCGWENTASGEVKMARGDAPLHQSAFCGFHVVEQSLLRTMLPVRKFPIIDAYIKAASRFDIGEARLSDDYYWFDVGTPEKLEIVEEFINTQYVRLSN